MKKTIVLGNNYDSYLVSLLLCQHKKLSVSHIEAQFPLRSQIEILPPVFRQLLKTLTISEDEFTQETGAQPHVAFSYNNWPGHHGLVNFHIPYRSQLDFYYYPTFINNTKLRRQGYLIDANPDNFLFNSILARKNLSPYSPINFPFENDYGFYVNNQKLTAFLKNKLKEISSVNIIQAKKLNCLCLNQNTYECHVDIDDNRSLIIDSDFIINTLAPTQFKLPDAFSKLSVKGYNEIQTKEKLAVSTYISKKTSCVSYHSDKEGNGYYVNTPSGDDTKVSFFYPKNEITEEQSSLKLKRFISNTFGQFEFTSIGITEQFDEKPYQFNKACANNLINIGKAYFHLDNIHAVNESILLESIQILVHALCCDISDMGNIIQKENANKNFNNDINLLIDNAVSFQKAIYHYQCSNSPITDTKENQTNFALTHWQTNEVITSETISKQSLFTDIDWNCLLAGLGVFPKTETLVDHEALKAFDFETMEMFFNHCALNFSTKPSVGDDI